MYVDRQVGDLTDTLDDWLAQGEVRYEVVIHHIDVDEIGIADRFEVTLEIAKIGGQDARCDLNTHNTHSMEYG